MNVEVQYTPDCANVRPVLQRLEQLAALREDLTLTVVRIDPADPIPAGFAGSPTVLIDGQNRFEGVPTDAAACALHPPTAAQVEDALDSI